MERKYIRGFPDRTYVATHCDQMLWYKLKAEAALHGIVLPVMLDRALQFYFKYGSRMRVVQTESDEDSGSGG